MSSTLAERERALFNVHRDANIIVYCQSYGCAYGEEIADFLHFNGFSNLSLYLGGWIEWKRYADAEYAAVNAKSSDTELANQNGRRSRDSND